MVAAGRRPAGGWLARGLVLELAATRFGVLTASLMPVAGVTLLGAAFL